jgi:hypothetical protein
VPQPYRIRTEKSWLETEDDLAAEFRLWGVKPRDWSAKRDGRKVVLRWIPKGADAAVTLESSDQAGPAENLRKLYKLVEDLRGLEMRGYAQEVASYYAQTTAIVEHESTKADRYAPYHVLDLTPSADRETVDAVTRSKLRKAHPDAGGTAAEAARVNDARDAIYRERGWK